MSSVGTFLKKYNVHIGLGVLIVGIHWGWYKMQHMDALVAPEERKGFPINININNIQKKLLPSTLEKPEDK